MHSQEIIIAFVTLSTIMFIVLISVILNIISLHKKNKENHHKELELMRTTFEKELLKTQLEMQEQTFNRIALDLHDNVGNFLSLANLHLSSLDCGELSEVREKVSESMDLLATSLNQIRNLSKTLNSECIRENGLTKTIEALVQQVEKTGSFGIEFYVTGEAFFFDDQKEVLLFRIVQEAFNNIFRHSKAKLITVTLDFSQSGLKLTIKDNGVGFNVQEVLNNYNPSKHSGLRNIMTRSHLINAKYEIDSAYGKGTTINILTPY